MKTEMFEIVNRNHRAVRYLEKNRKEERRNTIVLSAVMIGIAIILIVLYV